MKSGVSFSIFDFRNLQRRIRMPCNAAFVCPATPHSAETEASVGRPWTEPTTQQNGSVGKWLLSCDKNTLNLQPLRTYYGQSGLTLLDVDRLCQLGWKYIEKMTIKQYKKAMILSETKQQTLLAIFNIYLSLRSKPSLKTSWFIPVLSRSTASDQNALHPKRISCSSGFVHHCFQCSRRTSRRSAKRGCIHCCRW